MTKEVKEIKAGIADMLEHCEASAIKYRNMGNLSEAEKCDNRGVAYRNIIAWLEDNFDK